MKTATVLIGAALLAALTAAGQDAPSKHEQDLKMPEIVNAMGLTTGARAADIGAGFGDYESTLSRAVGAGGQIYAEDISSDALKGLRRRVKNSHLENVKVVTGAPDDPKLAAGELDAVLMVITYHEVKDYQKILEHVKAALKPGGRYVIVDLSPRKTANRPRADQVKNHVIAADTVESEVRRAGFEVVSRDYHFIDHPDEESTRWMIVFRKPA